MTSGRSFAAACAQLDALVVEHPAPACPAGFNGSFFAGAICACEAAPAKRPSNGKTPNRIERRITAHPQIANERRNAR